jgi:hypothetical protein
MKEPTKAPASLGRKLSSHWGNKITFGNRSQSFLIEPDRLEEKDLDEVSQVVSSDILRIVDEG